MRQKLQIAQVTLISVVLVTATACDRSPAELRLVRPVSPIDSSIAEELAAFLDSHSSIRIELTESAFAEEDALDAITSGDADIALVTNNLPFREEIATVMPLYPTILHIARRQGDDTPLGPEALRGVTVYAGQKGSASRYVFERLIERIGLSDDDYRYLEEPVGEPDFVVVFAPISPERIEKLPAGLVLSGLGSPDDIGKGNIVDAAVLLNPHFRTFVIPAGTYGTVAPEPIVTIAVDKILVTRADLDSSVVYDLINDLLRLRPALAAKRPGLFEPLTEDFDASRSRFVLHAGTQAYLQRDVPSAMERYSGVAEVVATLFVALATAAIAGVRILARRRKNRIDRYYAATIDIRNSIGASIDDTARRDAITELRNLQNEAFDLLVKEKLAADESFRIFITLSDDVLRQLGATGPDDHPSDA